MVYRELGKTGLQVTRLALAASILIASLIHRLRKLLMLLLNTILIF